MTARPRKNAESPEEYRRALLHQVFTSGETHAEHKEETTHVQKKFEVKDHASLLTTIMDVNGDLFCAYMHDQHIHSNDFDHQKMFAKIYTDMIHAMLIDFIECNERGELDG